MTYRILEISVLNFLMYFWDFLDLYFFLNLKKKKIKQCNAQVTHSQTLEDWHMISFIVGKFWGIS